jgi:hypothetical protein
MSSVGLPIRPTDNRMDVQLGIVIFHCDIAQQRKKFNLFVDGDLPVFHARWFEEAEDYVTESADACNLRSADPVAGSEFKKSMNHLIAFVEDDRKRTLTSLGLVQDFRFHAALSSCGIYGLIARMCAQVFSAAPVSRELAQH